MKIKHRIIMFNKKFKIKKIKLVLSTIATLHSLNATDLIMLKKNFFLQT